MDRVELLDTGDARLAPAADLDTARVQLRDAFLADAGPIGHRDDVLGFLDEHADAAHRSCESGHLTGSALVVDATGSRTLLMLHRKLGRWFQPGGHADGDNRC